MRLSFAKSGWRTGVVLLLSLILIEAMSFICAEHNWEAAVDLLTAVSVVLLLANLLFGFTANIGLWGRVLLLTLIFGYMAFVVVGLLKFYSPTTPG